MIVIAFVDNYGGMMFCNIRQSRDNVALQKIIDMTADSSLWVIKYSASLFTQFDAPQIKVDSRFLDKAGQGEFCFVENADILPYNFFIEKIILFYWNQCYPSDKKFPINVQSPMWECVAQEDFPGVSHERITMKIYEK